MADEHYAFNNTNTTGVSFFDDPISRTSCQIWESNDESYALKVANIPPWKEDWDEILQYQLDIRHKPCNFVEIMPRLNEK